MGGVEDYLEAQNLLVPTVSQVRGAGQSVLLVHRRRQNLLVPWVMQVKVLPPALGHVGLELQSLEQKALCAWLLVRMHWNPFLHMRKPPQSPPKSEAGTQRFPAVCFWHR